LSGNYLALSSAGVEIEEFDHSAVMLFSHWF